ncbi:hypothetical protein E4T56_gene2639 [Termitomyces sp. T112]|nr:hypothetical protein E4T56_gene2639 [Termitomyces sp. T112]
MKPMSFLRNVLRMKEKKKSKPSSVEPYLLKVPPVSPSSESSSTEATPALSLDFEHSLKVPDHPAIYDLEAENWEISSPQIGLKDGSLLLLSSQQNASHGPTVSDLEGTSFRHMSNSQHPPRSLLHSSSRPPSPITPLTRVTFSPEPHIRTLRSSSSRQTFLPIEAQNQDSFSSDITEMTDEKNCDFEEIGMSAMNPAVSLRKSSVLQVQASLDSTNTAHVVLDSPNSLVMRTLNHSSSSSPHLPITQTRFGTGPQLHDEDLNSSQDTLASFPSPPPLKVRKRPPPLVLPSAPTTGQSPLAGSTYSTPLATPLPSPRSFKFSGRPLHTVTPPPHSPPNSPLPTPPTSPAFLVPSDYRNLSGKTLRTMHSTSEMRDLFEVTHPLSDVFARDNATRWRNQCIIAAKSEYSSLETMETSGPSHEPTLSETQIQWGYAL